MKMKRKGNSDGEHRIELEVVPAKRCRYAFKIDGRGFSSKQIPELEGYLAGRYPVNGKDYRVIMSGFSRFSSRSPWIAEEVEGLRIGLEWKLNRKRYLARASQEI